jgi:hypothetical protein
MQNIYIVLAHETLHDQTVSPNQPHRPTTEPSPAKVSDLPLAKKAQNQPTVQIQSETQNPIPSCQNLANAYIKTQPNHPKFNSKLGGK